MNTPNKLTVARMIIVPFLVVFLLTGWGGDTNRYISLALFVVASVTDWFDGYLARKNNLVTNFGKFMDPLADKLLVCSAMICMIELNRLPAWFVIIIIGREFIISGFRLIAAENGIVIAANYWGKFKTASQMIMIILLILHFDGIFVTLEQLFIWLSLALTILSILAASCGDFPAFITSRTAEISFCEKLSPFFFPEAAALIRKGSISEADFPLPFSASF